MHFTMRKTPSATQKQFPFSRMGRHHLDVVRIKIRDLQAIESVLAQTIAHCTGSDTPDCPLLDVLNDGLAKP